MDKQLEVTTYEMAQICEIASIAGKLEGKQENGIGIKLEGTLDELFDEVYLPIYKEWKTGVGTKIFKDSEEEGYIGAYAERRLIELYGMK